MRIAVFVCAVVLLCACASAFDVCERGGDPMMWSVFDDYFIPMQFSSHDRLGLNSDGFLGIWGHYGRDEQGRQVIFDEQGPGVITRIWFTAADISWLGNIQFFFDDEPFPRIEGTYEQLLGCQIEPFVEPFCYDATKSSGGWVLLYPIPFKKRLTIKVSGKVFFVQITWRRARYGERIESFTGQEDCSALAALLDPERPAQPLIGGDVQDSGIAVIEPGQTATISEGTGAGTITWLAFDIGDLDRELLDRIALVLEFDGKTEERTDVPLFAAFGYLSPVDEVVTPGVGISGGVGYLAFPMPFWKSYSVALRNGSDSTVEIPWQIELSGDAPPASRAGWFRIVEAITDPTQIFADATLLELPGRGNYMGLALDMTGVGASRGYLEGDEHIHVDGMPDPVIVGTGTEDFFSGGWYFRHGPFCLPTHGNPVHELADGRDRTVCYRHFYAMPLSFRDGIRATIEHDAYNSVPGDSYRAVAYLYHAPSPSLAWRRTCRLDDPESMLTCGYRFGEGYRKTVIGVFEDESALHAHTYTGYEVRDWSRIDLSGAGRAFGVWLLRTTVADPSWLAFDAGAFSGELWWDRWWNPFKRLHQQVRILPPEAVDEDGIRWYALMEPYVDLELETAAVRLPNIDNIDSVATGTESIELRVGECVEFTDLLAT
ncbi:MAG TPA: DUF2961 domain-containing protein, partial [Proteobacteria bacterium]|nr:DUF2961 domain-containing protein [Pseudomonadota bacterium]